MALKPLRPNNGPILDYLANVAQNERADILARVQAVLETPDGAILMELLENAVTLRQTNLGLDPRASEYAMAQRFIVSDLQLIVRTERGYLQPHATGRRERTG